MPCTSDAEPGVVQKAIFIKNFVIARCRTPWQVTLRTSLIAESNLVLGFVNTSPKDFVRFLLRPKGARTQRHGIFGLLTSEGAAEDEALQDTAKLAADLVHLATGWEKPTYSDGIMHVWDVVNIVERAAFYVMIVNLVEDFAFNWYSGIVLAKESQCALGRFEYTTGTTGLVGPGPATRPIFDTIFEHGTVHRQFPGIALGPGLWYVKLRGQAETAFGGPPTGKLFARMMLGSASPQQCGKTITVDMDTYPIAKIWEYVHMVQGPDFLSIELSQLLPGGYFGSESGYVEVSGFRMD